MSNMQTQHDFLTEEVTDLVEELVGQQKLVVYNDDVNTFDYVIDSLIDICNHSPEQAEQCSIIIHYKGKATVREGVMDELYPMKSGLSDRGISAVIE